LAAIGATFPSSSRSRYHHHHLGVVVVVVVVVRGMMARGAKICLFSIHFSSI
jgi:hypothetical protein